MVLVEAEAAPATNLGEEATAEMAASGVEASDGAMGMSPLSAHCIDREDITFLREDAIGEGCYRL